MEQRLKRLHEALSFLYHKLGGRKVSRVKMAQLEYLAERKVMQEDGDTLAETQFVNTSFGPMGVNVIRLLDGNFEMPPMSRIPWALSEYDVRVLGEIVDTFGKLSTPALTAKIGELCPEWRKPRGDSAEALGFPAIWRSLGFSDDAARRVEQERLIQLAVSESWERADKAAGGQTRLLELV